MLLTGIITALPLAATSGGEEESSNFLVSPDVGLMIWTVLAFLVALWVLRKYAFPQISAALEKRQHLIEESIDTAQRTKDEADQIRAEPGGRQRGPRGRAEEFAPRPRRAGEAPGRRAGGAPRARRGALPENPRRDIEAETRRAIQ